MNDSNIATNSQERAASQIASVMQGMQHIHEAWCKLNSDERTHIIQAWADFLRKDPANGVDLIIYDIETSSELKDAWNQLGQHSKTDRKRLFQSIVDNSTQISRA